MVRSTQQTTSLAAALLAAALLSCASVHVSAESGLRGGGSTSHHEEAGIIADLLKGTLSDELEGLIDDETFNPFQRHRDLLERADPRPVPIEGQLSHGDFEAGAVDIDDESFLDPIGDRDLEQNRETEVTSLAGKVTVTPLTGSGRFDGTFHGNSMRNRGRGRNGDANSDEGGYDELMNSEEGGDMNDSSDAVQKRIVQGGISQENDMAMGTFMKKSNGQYYQGYCGCKAISATWVISAAHCHSNMANNDLKDGLKAVYFNARNMYKVNANGQGNDGHPFAVRDIKQCIRHPLHQPGGAAPYDMMLCELTAPIHSSMMTDLPAVADTSYMNAMATGTPSLVQGLGQTSFGGAKSTEMKEVSLPYVKWDSCKSKLGQYGFDQTMGCAGGEGNGDACGGDSGGPISVSPGDGTKSVQWGVVSWGFQCDVSGKPGAYSTTHDKITWIEQYVGGDTGFVIASAGFSGIIVNTGVSYSAAQTTTTTATTTTTTQASAGIDSRSYFTYWNTKRNSWKSTSCSKAASKNLCGMPLAKNGSSNGVKSKCPQACS